MKYVNEISKVLTGNDSSKNSVVNQFAIPGTEIIAKTLKDTIDAFKGKWGSLEVKKKYEKMCPCGGKIKPMID